MTSRSAIGAIGCAVLIPMTLAVAVEAAQPADAEVSELRQQIIELRQRVEALEARLDEGVPVNMAARVEPVPGGWRESHNWKLLRKGMDHHRLRAVLGEPESTRKIGKFRIWRYPNGEVKLYLRRVTSWSN